MNSFMLFGGESIDLGNSLKIDLLSKWHIRYPGTAELVSEPDMNLISAGS